MAGSTKEIITQEYLLLEMLLIIMMMLKYKEEYEGGTDLDPLSLMNLMDCCTSQEETNST